MDGPIDIVSRIRTFEGGSDTTRDMYRLVDTISTNFSQELESMRGRPKQALPEGKVTKAPVDKPTETPRTTSTADKQKEAGRTELMTQQAESADLSNPSSRSGKEETVKEVKGEPKAPSKEAGTEEAPKAEKPAEGPQTGSKAPVDNGDSQQTAPLPLDKNLLPEASAEEAKMPLPETAAPEVELENSADVTAEVDLPEKVELPLENTEQPAEAVIQEEQPELPEIKAEQEAAEAPVEPVLEELPLEEAVEEEELEEIPEELLQEQKSADKPPEENSAAKVEKRPSQAEVEAAEIAAQEVAKQNAAKPKVLTEGVEASLRAESEVQVRDSSLEMVDEDELSEENRQANRQEQISSLLARVDGKEMDRLLEGLKQVSSKTQIQPLAAEKVSSKLLTGLRAHNAPLAQAVDAARAPAQTTNQGQGLIDLRRGETPAQTKPQGTEKPTGKGMDHDIEKLRQKVMDQIRFQVRMALRNNIGDIQLRLRPEFLGNVRVNLLIEPSSVSANFLVENNTVREAILRNVNQLHMAASEQNIEFRSLDVNVSADGSGDNQNGRAFASDEDQKAVRQWVNSFHRIGTEPALETGIETEVPDNAVDEMQLVNLTA